MCVRVWGLGVRSRSDLQASSLPRLSKELQEKDQLIGRLQAKLRAHSMTPSSSRTMSESPRTGSSASFLSDGLEGCSDMDEVSEDAQDPVDPREGQRPKRLDPGTGLWLTPPLGPNWPVELLYFRHVTTQSDRGCPV